MVVTIIDLSPATGVVGELFGSDFSSISVITMAVGERGWAQLHIYILTSFVPTLVCPKKCLKPCACPCNYSEETYAWRSTERGDLAPNVHSRRPNLLPTVLMYSKIQRSRCNNQEVELPLLPSTTCQQLAVAYIRDICIQSARRRLELLSRAHKSAAQEMRDASDLSLPQPTVAQLYFEWYYWQGYQTCCVHCS